MILGVTGTNGAGKGAVVEYLKQKGFHHYSVSGAITEEIIRRGLPVNRPNMRLVGNDLREKRGADYFINDALAKAEQEGFKDLIVESIRNITEAKNIKAHGGMLLVVDADRPIRYQRIVGRGSEKDKVDFDTWVAQEEAEWHDTTVHGMAIPAVMKLADYTLINNGSLGDLHQQIDTMLAQIVQKS